MKRSLLILALLLGIAAPAAAQEQVTLDKAIEIAIANNRSLKISRLGIENADEQVHEAYASTLPTVTLNARYTRNIERPVFYMAGQDGVTRAVSLGADNALVTDLTVNQIVFNSAVLDGVGTAETYSKVSRQQLRQSTSEVVLNVKRAYYGALLARDLLAVNEALLRNGEDNYRQTAALAKAGLRAEFDAIRSEVQVSNQRPVVVQARNTYEMAIDNLKVVLGLSGDQQISLAETLARPASLTVVEPSVEEAERILRANNPQLKSLELVNEVNRQMIKIKGADYLPTVALFGTWQYQAQADNIGDLSFSPTAYVGLNVSYNIFNGYRTTAQVEQANILYQQSQQQLEQVSMALATQLSSTLRRINYARERIGSTDKTIDLAERGYRIAMTSYKAGTGTQLQINDADLALAQSKVNQLVAVHDYYVALAELEQLLGERFTVTGDDRDVKYSSR
jgi:outer membrane protein TolC